MVRILLVDDHALFRQGLARLLDADAGFQVVGQCATVNEAVEALATTGADVVLLDIDLPGPPVSSFFDLLPPERRPPTLLVTAVTNLAEVAHLLRRGARGIFSKASDSSRLPGAIRQILAGENWIDHAYMQAFVGAADTVLEEPPGPAPSGRERHVLALVCRGFSNKQIAEELGFSEPAVKAALQRLFRKFGVGNRAQLVAVSAEAIHGRD